MITSQSEEKAYFTYNIEWNPDEEEYEHSDEVLWNGEPLEFNTYQEFLDFMAQLTKEEKEYLGLWRLEHNFTGDYITVNDGIFDDVSFISINAKQLETND